MSMKHMAQHHPQAWSWELPMINPQYQYCHHHNHRVEQEEARHEREHMFEKALTPSDVGKLNRLVIPKQHAEKYFPLDGDSGEKGMLLSFEDESGKPWRFRYSYWTSSQSYVLTKGWSRFVKEKRLDAGDVVSFERLRGRGVDGLHISCRRRSGNDRPPAACTATMAKQERLVHGESSKAMPPPAHSKRLRLFGVNLDYCVPPEVLAPETGPVHAHQCL